MLEMLERSDINDPETQRVFPLLGERGRPFFEVVVVLLVLLDAGVVAGVGIPVQKEDPRLCPGVLRVLP